MYRYLLGAAVTVVAGLSLAPLPASAADGIYVPLFSYRTGPFAGSGTPIVNGMADYLNMLNERDGGIGGVKLIVEECETGYDTKKGLECYEQVKSKNPVVTNPYSTGITLPLIGKAAIDKIPVLSMAYGLSASAGRQKFPRVFQPPAPAITSPGSSTRRRLTGTALQCSSPTPAARKAASTSSRARSWVSFISTRLTARSRFRCWKRWPRITASN